MSRRGSGLTAIIYPCAPGVCGEDNLCKNNRTGPVLNACSL
jgi:hypothetical protein